LAVAEQVWEAVGGKPDYVFDPMEERS